MVVQYDRPYNVPNNPMKFEKYVNVFVHKNLTQNYW